MRFVPIFVGIVIPLVAAFISGRRWERKKPVEAEQEFEKAFNRLSAQNVQFRAFQHAMYDVVNDNAFTDSQMAARVLGELQHLSGQLKKIDEKET